jgi:putative endonuclease
MKPKSEIGHEGENRAMQYLIDSGYKILERNYRYGRAEIDIICRIDHLIVFVEVKTRKNNAFGYPESFVSDSQAERIMEAADEFTFSKNWEGNIRFDIISIETSMNNKITHFKDAFH